jgi:hypothetical protein
MARPCSASPSAVESFLTIDLMATCMPPMVLGCGGWQAEYYGYLLGVT